MDSCFHAIAENGAKAGRERTDPICYVSKKTALFPRVSAVCFCTRLLNVYAVIFESVCCDVSVLCVLQAVQSLEISF